MSSTDSGPGYKLFHVFRVSCLLPNAKGEKYQFKGVSANSWLSPIGIIREKPLFSEYPYNIMRPQTVPRWKGRAKSSKVIQNIGKQSTGFNDNIDKNEVLKGIKMKTKNASELDAGYICSKESLPSCCKDTVETRKKVPINDNSNRPNTCPANVSKHSATRSKSYDLTITATGLNKSRNCQCVDKSLNKEEYSKDDRPSENFPDMKKLLNERLKSAPPGLNMTITSHPSTTTTCESSRSSFSKTGDIYSRRQATPKGRNEDKSMHGPVLRSLLQRSSSDFNHSNGCPYKCKGCFRACLASEEYLSRLKSR